MTNRPVGGSQNMAQRREATGVRIDEIAAIPESMIVVKEARVCKVNEDLGIVFGWAIICNQDGQPYFDLQHEHIPEDVMLKGSAELMAGERTAREMHREGSDHGQILFAFPVTEELCKATGITSPKTGLLIGMKPSKEVLAKFASGEYTGFSVGGGAYYKDAEEATTKNKDEHGYGSNPRGEGGPKPKPDAIVHSVDSHEELPTFGTRAQAKAHAEKHGGTAKFSSQHGGWIVEPGSKGNPINFGNGVGGSSAFGKVKHDDATNADILHDFLSQQGI